MDGGKDGETEAKLGLDMAPARRVVSLWYIATREWLVHVAIHGRVGDFAAGVRPLRTWEGRRGGGRGFSIIV